MGGGGHLTTVCFSPAQAALGLGGLLVAAREGDLAWGAACAAWGHRQNLLCGGRLGRWQAPTLVCLSEPRLCVTPRSRAKGAERKGRGVGSAECLAVFVVAHEKVLSNTGGVGLCKPCMWCV